MKLKKTNKGIRVRYLSLNISTKCEKQKLGFYLKTLLLDIKP